MKKIIKGAIDSIRRNEKSDLAIAAIVFAVITLPVAFQKGFWDPYETHYAEVAREAAENGFFNFQYEGKPLPFLPPVFFTIITIAMKSGISSDIAIRLIFSIIHGIIFIYLLYLVKIIFNRKTLVLFAFSIVGAPFYFGGVGRISPILLSTVFSFVAIICFTILILRRGTSLNRKLCSPLHFWVATTLSLLTGGIVSALAILSAVISYLIFSTVGGKSAGKLKNVISLPGIILFMLFATGWLIKAGKEAFTFHPFSFGAIENFKTTRLFTFHIKQLGHMLYPVFILLPASILWIAGVKATEIKEVKNITTPTITLGGGSVVFFLVRCLPGKYMPDDMTLIAPSVTLLTVMGIVRAMEAENNKTNADLISFGALLIILGCASIGVDYFWNPARPIEVIGYWFDRPYPKLHDIVKAVYNFIVIVGGASCSSALFFRKRVWMIYWSFLILPVASSLFVGNYLFRVCGKYFSARKLLDSYKPVEKTGDILISYLMDKQARGGETYYFRNRVKKVTSDEELKKFMEIAHGGRRLIVISSHVRSVYNNIYKFSCGYRITPINKERSWYSISSYEGPPPLEGERFKYEDVIELQISNRDNKKLYYNGENYLTFIGYDIYYPSGKEAHPRNSILILKKGFWIDINLYFKVERQLLQRWKIYLTATPGNVSRSYGKVKYISNHHIPACGLYPVYLWKKGEIVKDRSRLYFPLDTEEGSYEVKTTLFGEGGRRMKLMEESAHRSTARSFIKLCTVKIE